VSSDRHAAQRGIFVAPFDELSDPRVMAEIAAEAEAAGWDGFFVWDHVAYRAPTRAIADPWVTLSAIACATKRMRIGPLVTPLSRRRVHKVARETATLDALSGGRLTFGIGLGSDNNGELEPFGDVVDPRERARLLDDGMEALADFWTGTFEPRPIQRPRIPVWVGGRWPRRKPLERAARWDGFFPIELPDPDALVELAAAMRELRGSLDGYDLVIEHSPGEDPAPWVAAGATWCLTSFGQTPSREEVAAAIKDLDSGT
jgi:alkanesulfonate monooxygenase SsuD/methylene tetrahydromethanopterin reductase-like flavin-dependent oxidoreductase (luciferase family)